MDIESKLYEKGQVLTGLFIRSGGVYQISNGGYATCIGTISEADYSWSEDEPVPDMDDATLVVLDNYGFLKFGKKQLINKLTFIDKYITELSINEKEHMFDIYMKYRYADAGERLS